MAANSHSIDLEDTESDYLSAADSPSLSITGDLSISLWVKRETTATTQVLVAKQVQTGDQRSWNFRFSNDKLQFIVSADGVTDGAAITVGDAVTDTNWHQVGLEYDASAGDVQFYVDGATFEGRLTGTLPTSIFNSTAIFTIGTRGAADIQFFDGLIDEVVVTSDTVTSTEMDQLFDGAYATDILNNVAIYWDANNNTTDQSGNGNTLTNNGGAFVTTVPFANYTTGAQAGKSTAMTTNTKFFGG